MKALFYFLFLASAVMVFLPEAEAQRRVEDFTFNPLDVRRDPFSPPEVETKGEENDLIKYDLLEVKLVAIMTGLGNAKAMVVLPNGVSHIIQEGDRIGKNKGFVSRITKTEVAVVESFKDFRGRTKKNYEKLTIE